MRHILAIAEGPCWCVSQTFITSMCTCKQSMYRRWRLYSGGAPILHVYDNSFYSSSMSSKWTSLVVVGMVADGKMLAACTQAQVAY